MLMLLLLLLVSGAYSVPSNLTCPAVAKLSQLDLYGCKFTDMSHVSCTIVADAYADYIITKFYIVLEFNTTFHIQEECPDAIDGQMGWWCLNIHSTTLKKLDKMPSNVLNRMTLPSMAAPVLAVVTPGVAVVNFYNEAVAGFLKLKDGCDTNTTDSSCIARLRGATYAVAPRDKDISLWDIFTKVMDLYFEQMGGVLSYLEMSTVLSSTVSSLWLTHLSKTHIRQLNVSNNNFEGDLDHKFTDLVNLTVWEMRNCNLRQIDPDNFAGTPNLKYLDLCGNKFSSPPEKISLLSQLEALNMCSQHEIVNFHLGLEIRCLKNLKTLKLLGLPLADLSRSSLPRNLEHLDMSRCRLTSLPADLFHDSKSLQTLILSSNYLTQLEQNTFVHLQPGAQLLLRDNQIKSGQKLNITWLSLLDMSRNAMQSPNDVLSSGTVDLLDISHNLIINWTSSSTFKFPTERSSCLNQERAGIDSLSGLFLNYIALIDGNKRSKQENSFTEQAPRKHKVNNEHSATILDNIADQLISYEIKNVNISYNLIPVVEHAMIDSLNSLESVDLGGNQFDCQNCYIREFQQWISTTNTSILLLNETEPIECVLPPQQRGQPLLAAEYNITACELTPVNYKIVAGVPITLILIFLIVSSLILYSHRHEVAYIKHLYNVKKRSTNKERTGCKYDCFVSYSGKDREFVIDILLSLENPTDKYLLCLHERDFRIGGVIMDNVVECMNKSRRTLFVLTNNYIKSRMCQWELRMAQHRVFEEDSAFLILLELEKLDNDLVPLHLRQLMASRTYLEWPGDLSNVAALRSFWDRLKQALGPALVTTGAPLSSDSSSTSSESAQLQDFSDDDDDVAFVVPKD